MTLNLLNIPRIEIYKELYKRGEYDFVCYNKDKDRRNEKQKLALRLLNDSDVTELMYGGAAGGAKSWTGSTWLLFNCLLYPGTRWFIGRESLKDIRDSTLITFGKVANRYGLIALKDYKYNGQDNFIYFPNGSRIDMLDLAFMPSDPMYERLGSKEYTGGFIEECGQIHFNAFDVLKTRINRHLNDKYKLKAKIFLTCNPKKNWIYSYFVLPKREGKLKNNQEFISSLATDNAFPEDGYIQQLMSITDKVQRERLLNGNFDYDDDPTALIGLDAANNCFTNTFVPAGAKYITCDVARYGRDKTVIGIWSGWRLFKIYVILKSGTDEVKGLLDKLRIEHQVPLSNIIVDEDGVGGGVVDFMKCKGFVNNSKPLEVKGKKQNFKNLKSQCSFGLADLINSNQVYFYQGAFTVHEQEELKEELQYIKQKNMDKDAVREVLGKDEVKASLGRSPDFSDMVMMRYWFELMPAPQKWTFA